MDMNIVLVLCLCASPLLAHDHDGCLDEKEGPTFAATIFATNSSVTSDDIKCPVARDCQEWLDNGVSRSGAYPVDPDGSGPFQVYCDMETDGGGWTVFQRRQDGSVDFNRPWHDYEQGFGHLHNEFWLGLRKIHQLTKAGIANSLRIELEDFNGNRPYAKYTAFNISSSSELYVITIDGYLGNASDSLSYHNGLPFTTKDRDNDQHSDKNCAVKYKGGWWFNQCHRSNLNGLYRDHPVVDYDTVHWYYWTNDCAALKFAEMKLRRNSNNS